MSKKLTSLYDQALLPTIVVTLVFFINYWFFGLENTMIGPFITLSFLRFRNISNHYECMAKTFFIYAAITILAFFAVINLPLCICINAIVLFWIAFFLIDEYNPTNYFPAGMALIFFQIAPVTTVQKLFTRMEALSVSFLIVFGFIVLLSFQKSAKNPICGYIQKGLDNCVAQRNAFASHDNTKLEILHHELCNLNKQICDEIYTYNRASIRLAAKINWYCRFTALFQVINYMTQVKEPTKELLSEMEQMLYHFQEQFATRQPAADYKRLYFRNNKPDIRSFRMRFALRLVIICTPCLAFAYLVPFENSYWLVISVFFMMIPVTDHTKKRIRQRVLGTIIGIVACFVLFSIFKELPARILIMTIANFFIYESSNYATMVAYITCSALAIQSLDATVPIVLSQRLVYTAIGGVIAYLGNKFVFPIRIRDEMVYLMERLDLQRKQMAALTPQKEPDDAIRRHQKDQLIVKSYLLMKRLQDYHAALPAEQQKASAFAAYEKKHMLFMAKFLQDHLMENQNI